MQLLGGRRPVLVSTCRSIRGAVEPRLVRERVIPYGDTHWTRTFLTTGRGVLHPRFDGVDEKCLVRGPVLYTTQRPTLIAHHHPNAATQAAPCA